MYVHSHHFCCSLLKWVFVALTFTKNVIRRPGCLTHPIPTRVLAFSVVDSILKIPGRILNMQNLKVVLDLLSQNLHFNKRLRSFICMLQFEELWPRV